MGSPNGKGESGEAIAVRELYVGRFQPIHRGHRTFLEEAADEVDAHIVGVGNGRAVETVENLFTAGERRSFIQSSNADTKSTAFGVPIDDSTRYAIWPAHKAAMATPLGVGYSNNPFIRQRFGETGHEGGRLVNRTESHGRAIREGVIAGDPWRDRVPDPLRREFWRTMGAVGSEDWPDRAMADRRRPSIVGGDRLSIRGPLFGKSIGNLFL